jgi:hypothetical protein
MTKKKSSLHISKPANMYYYKDGKNEVRIMIEFSKKDTERFDKLWGKGGQMEKTVKQIKKVFKKYGVK